MEYDINNIINAANYEDIADFSIIPPENKFFSNEILKNDCIIFCKTDFIGYLFQNLNNSTKKHVLITHHSDYEINSNIFLHKPKSIIKWFAINATHVDESLNCIPLGLKTHRGIYLEEKYMTNWFVENLKNLRSNFKENKVYCNWTDTNSYRNQIISKLRDNNIEFIIESNLTFDKYAKSMSKCKYVISPPGNGIDCHRTWESLYLGCIPIVIRNKIYDNWPDLPILQVDDYSDLSQKIIDDFSKKQFNFEMLYLEYWKNIIKKF